MSFSDVVGHGSAVKALQHALEANHLAGAYLFVGPEGVGKTALAMAFAKAAACLDPVSEPFDACGKCDSCRRVVSGAHPEIVLIPPAGGQTQIWQFWDRDGKPAGALENTLIHSPVIGKKRIFIIEKAETLTIPAANSLLKALEEPPSYVVFILLATHAARLLPTILSRSMILRLNPCSLEELKSYLHERMDVPEDKASIFAAYSEGRIGTAIRICSNRKAFDAMDELADFTFHTPEIPPIEAFKYSEQLRKRAASSKALLMAEENSGSDEGDDEMNTKDKAGRTQMGAMLEMMALCYRDLMAASVQEEEAALIFLNHRENILRIARGRSFQGWWNSLDAILKARRSLDRNVSIPLLMDWLAVQLTNQNMVAHPSGPSVQRKG